MGTHVAYIAIAGHIVTTLNMIYIMLLCTGEVIQ